jgi:hypothetical protein
MAIKQQVYYIPQGRKTQGRGGFLPAAPKKRSAKAALLAAFALLAVR